MQRIIMFEKLNEEDIIKIESIELLAAPYTAIFTIIPHYDNKNES